jgi:hypothetical protein
MDDLSQEIREQLLDILPRKQHKRIDAILEVVETAVYPYLAVDEVEVIGARVAVETVSAYGLDIRVDANGNATTVGFPYGGELR